MQLTKARFKENLLADLLARNQKISLANFIKDLIIRFHW
jgi:hypothetical protein